MIDYEKYEKECKKIKKENEKLLEDFSSWLAARNLSSKTIKKHVGNMDFYINEYLLYYEPKKAAEGAYDIDGFLGYWFIKKPCGPVKLLLRTMQQGLRSSINLCWKKG